MMSIALKRILLLAWAISLSTCGPGAAPDVEVPAPVPAVAGAAEPDLLTMCRRGLERAHLLLLGRNDHPRIPENVLGLAETPSQEGAAIVVDSVVVQIAPVVGGRLQWQPGDLDFIPSQDIEEVQVLRGPTSARAFGFDGQGVVCIRMKGPPER